MAKITPLIEKKLPKFDYRIQNILAAVMLVLVLSCSIALALFAFQSTFLFHGVSGL